MTSRNTRNRSGLRYPPVTATARATAAPSTSTVHETRPAMRSGTTRRASSTPATNTRYTRAIATTPARGDARGRGDHEQGDDDGQADELQDEQSVGDRRLLGAERTGHRNRATSGPVCTMESFGSLRSTRRWIARNSTMAASSARKTANDRPVRVVSSARAVDGASGTSEVSAPIEPSAGSPASAGASAGGARSVTAAAMAGAAAKSSTAAARRPVGGSRGRRGARRHEGREHREVDRRRRDRVGGGSARGRSRRLHGCRRDVDTRSCDPSTVGVAIDGGFVPVAATPVIPVGTVRVVAPDAHPAASRAPRCLRACSAHQATCRCRRTPPRRCRRTRRAGRVPAGPERGWCGGVPMKSPAVDRGEPGGLGSDVVSVVAVPLRGTSLTLSNHTTT